MAKRESGYAVRIYGFIPVAPTDLSAHAAAIAAVQAAEKGDFAAMLKLLQVERTSALPVQRRGKDAPAEEPPAKPPAIAPSQEPAAREASAGQPFTVSE